MSYCYLGVWTGLLIPVACHLQSICRQVRPFNECPSYDNKQSDGSINGGALRKAEYPFIAIAHRSTLARSNRLDRLPIMSEIEVNWVFVQNWIVWNRTVSDIATVLTLNWILWTVYDIETVWLNWIALNKNVLKIKLWTHAKVNCLM